MGPLAIAAGGALLKGLGSFFGKKSKQKDQKKAAAELNRSGQANWANSEAKRIANLKTLQAAAAARGVPLNMDPSLLNAMPYAGPDQTQFVGGTNLLGDALGGVGDIGINYAQYLDQKGSASDVSGTPAERPWGEGSSALELLLRQLEEQRTRRPGPWTSSGQPIGGL